MSLQSTYIAELSRNFIKKNISDHFFPLENKKYVPDVQDQMSKCRNQAAEYE